MAKKTKKQLKIEQANMQSDAREMGYSDGIQNTGSNENITYSFSDLDNDFDNWAGGSVATSYSVDGISFDYDDEKLREKLYSNMSANSKKTLEEEVEFKFDENTTSDDLTVPLLHLTLKCNALTKDDKANI